MIRRERNSEKGEKKKKKKKWSQKVTKESDSLDLEKDASR